MEIELIGGFHGRTRDSLDALQHFHQLSLLVWSHAGKHGGAQHELQRPHVERQRHYSNIQRQRQNVSVFTQVLNLSTKIREFSFSCHFIVDIVLFAPLH